MRYFFLFLLFLFFTATIPAAKPYKANPIPTFGSRQEENEYYFRRGRILIEGGYQGHAVWGKMVGLVAGPPEEVWRLFISANRWRSISLPSLKDARTVTAGVAEQSSKIREVEEFYRLLGGKVTPDEEGRVKGGEWTNYTFQSFNVPWPISDRWMVVKSRNDERRAAEGIFRADWTRMGGNVKTVDGHILITPFEGNQNVSWMEYRAISDPDVHVPRFLLKWGLYRVMPGVIKAIRRQINVSSIVLEAN